MGRRLLRWTFRIVAGLVSAIAVIAALNASCWSSYRGRTTLLAHRGIAQTLHASKDINTCTASIDPPVHGLLENTIASMQAAFDAGADIVEFDEHPTSDGQFAVFHDWTVDCKTEGHGRTRDHSMAQLKALDIGYGYTADGGKTFPLRGKGVGLMPTLDEVLSAFPDKRLLINVKSNDPAEGELLAARLARLPPGRIDQLIAYGGLAELVSRAHGRGRHAGVRVGTEHDRRDRHRHRADAATLAEGLLGRHLDEPHRRAWTAVRALIS